MKKLLKSSLLLLILVGINGCGETEDEYINVDKLDKLIFFSGTLPESFSIYVEKNDDEVEYLKYWIESSSKEIVILRELSKKSKEQIRCTEYSNESTLVAYDCVITSNKKNEKKSIIIEKGRKYNLYSSTNKYDATISGEIFIEKDNE